METITQGMIHLTQDNLDEQISRGTSPGGSTRLVRDDSKSGTISPPDSQSASPMLKPTDRNNITSSVPAPISTSSVGVKPLSPPLSHPSSPTSPIKSISPSSPPQNSRQFSPTSSSTRISSASSSQIFERNVQESHSVQQPSANAAAPLSAKKIPAHIATENHIPAVLEASSIAITDDSIDPENVEIAMLSTHQPVASQVSQHGHRCDKDKVSTGPSAEVADETIPPSTPHSCHSLGPSSTGDKRRLSFISFSDIVQAEQADLFDSTILSPSPLQTMNPNFPAQPMVDQAGLSGITETLRRRSPSPLRRPGSPPRTSATFLPERAVQEGLLVETMGQALRKTGSGDLGKGVF